MEASLSRCPTSPGESETERQGELQVVRKGFAAQGRHPGKGEASAPLGSPSTARKPEEAGGATCDAGEDAGARRVVGRSEDERLNRGDSRQELAEGELGGRAQSDDKGRRSKRRRRADNEERRAPCEAAEFSESLEAFLLGGPEPEGDESVAARPVHSKGVSGVVANAATHTQGSTHGFRRRSAYRSSCTSLEANGGGTTGGSKPFRSFSPDCGLASTTVGSSVAASPEGWSVSTTPVPGAGARATGAPNFGSACSMTPASRSRVPSPVGSPPAGQASFDGFLRSPSGEDRGLSPSRPDDCDSVSSGTDSAQNALREELQTMLSLGLLYLKRERDGEDTADLAAHLAAVAGRSKEPRGGEDCLSPNRTQTRPTSSLAEDEATPSGKLPGAAGHQVSPVSPERELPATRSSRGDRTRARAKGTHMGWPRGAEGDEAGTVEADRPKAKGGEEAAEDAETRERRRPGENGKDDAGVVGTAEKRLGVHYSRYDRSWVARYTQGGRVLKKYFSTKVYGHELAREKAVAARLEMEQQAQSSASATSGATTASSPSSEKAPITCQDGDAPSFSSSGKLAGVCALSSGASGSLGSGAEAQGPASSGSAAVDVSPGGVTPVAVAHAYGSASPSWVFCPYGQMPSAVASRSLSPYPFSTPPFCGFAPFASPAGPCTPAPPLWCSYTSSACAAVGQPVGGSRGRSVSPERPQNVAAEKSEASQTFGQADEAVPTTCVTPYGWITFTPFPPGHESSRLAREDLKRRRREDPKDRGEDAQRNETAGQRLLERRASLSAAEKGKGAVVEGGEGCRVCTLRGSERARTPQAVSLGSSASLAFPCHGFAGAACRACKAEPGSGEQRVCEQGASSGWPVEGEKSGTAHSKRRPSGTELPFEVWPTGFPGAGPVVPNAFPSLPFSPFPYFFLPSFQSVDFLSAPSAHFPHQVCSVPAALGLHGRAPLGRSASSDRPAWMRCSPSEDSSEDVQVDGDGGGEGAERIEFFERERRDSRVAERLVETVEVETETEVEKQKEVAVAPAETEEEIKAEQSEEGRVYRPRLDSRRLELRPGGRKKPSRRTPVSEPEGPLRVAPSAADREAGQETEEDWRDTVGCSENREDGVERLKLPQWPREAAGSDNLSAEEGKSDNACKRGYVVHRAHPAAGCQAASLLGVCLSSPVGRSPPGCLHAHSPCPFASPVPCSFLPPSPVGSNVLFPALFPGGVHPGPVFPAHLPLFSPVAGFAGAGAGAPAGPSGFSFGCSQSPRPNA
ncbi:AP2 domain transcription factor AP2X-2 [Toxoplasma gondii p89]|uniref:AP2 domain transcription factor AP2X-2 n=1 Tax=Toxoplasma gondii p89 TaxID=943119 RepID=A0A086KET4_TOXGO|nr:AP2 domain transcription factor AP2X-2 [Toxoplasma gondii p89]